MDFSDQPACIDLVDTISLRSTRFLVDYPNFMGDAAKVRMLELGLCRDHYRVHDPSLIGDDGSVPEELCKLKGVQSSLARIILAIPFGVLADKWGRKLICSIGILGVILHDTWYFVSLYFYKAFPTNAVYGAPAFILLGGGSVVVPAMIMAMLTHASTDEFRTVAFFYFSVTIMVSELIGPAIGSILTAAIGPHLAFLATIPSYFLSLVVMYFIKDEEPQATDACGLEQGEGNGLLDADYASSSTARSSRDYQSSSRGASPNRKHSMMEAVRFLRDDVWGLLLRASVLTGLLSLMVHRVYRPLLEVTIQYVSVRFGWKLRTANILLSTQAGVQIPVLLFIMPLLYRFLLRRKGSTFSANLAQASYCLVLLILGTLGMALAPVVPLFITSFIVYTLGNAYSAILRSLLASLVPQENFGLFWRHSALVYSALLTACARFATAADCPTENPFVILSQSDADKLSECGYFKGSINVAAEATGEIVLKGVNSIGGDWTVGSLKRDPATANLESISAPDLRTIEGVFEVEGHQNLKRLDFPELTRVLGRFEVRRVPELTELKVPALASVQTGFYIVDAPKLSTFVLPKTDDSSTSRPVPLCDIPNVDSLSVSLSDVFEFTVAGNGKLELTIEQLGSSQGGASVNITGVGAVENACSVWLAREVIFENNAAEIFPFSVSGLRKLTIQNNPNLRLAVPGKPLEWELTSIIVKDNPKLKLAQEVDDPIVETCDGRFKPASFYPETWVFDWEFLQHLELSADIDPKFLVHLTDDAFNSDDGTQVYTDIDIQSSNAEFNCSSLDYLRSEKRFLGGDYSCQNKTVDLADLDESAAGSTAPHLAHVALALVSLAVASMFGGLL
ncbi:unnamed protein product [Parascedosporium putredinis]|uniref:Uncharacterized protein n=1 Tax=Parascedosporium putredinis TaxID=1442378 RepID=A0A9P1H5N2_9PEZI|nr:unnamed protein product [Parascedosporium putredinis]CAI7996683.1 unnamed protein product [Parascedosporium putredinis]